MDIYNALHSENVWDEYLSIAIEGIRVYHPKYATLAYRLFEAEGI